MIELGKNAFRVNLTQMFTIMFCFGIAIIAKHFSMLTANMSLSDFISTSFQNIFEEDNNYSVFLNVLLPSILYVLSCLLLLWMGITNFFTLNIEKTNINIFLKCALGICELILFGWFLYIGGKLILDFVLFIALILLLVGMLLFVFGSSNER